ncbi:LuxR family transcriptional regulator [Flavobacterium sp. 9AF]|uniref:triple tyrosine motif-containing protein n=1 Tax=Flavobacterium sp. 9AF TaxID=2653142 RepID=UPI0012F322F4|nr:triple tyrosine motif-containing protein [Flavobacterium sp. 9AF]VXB99073.1 LuxR family transcriptional regulator [Flavobacterium sp. 9AF]
MRYLHTVLFFCFISLYSQELPPIVKYPQSLYAAGNQNWMITQDKKHSVFFANNEGLLEFNGANWILYPSPNETIIRSVVAIDDKIYTGAYMEFGYWSRNNTNELIYTSLSKKIKNKLKDDEQFWNILNYEQWIIFQSFNQIYIYNTKNEKFNIIKENETIIKSFVVNNAIYFHVANKGLFEIENGKSKLISKDSIFLNNKIVNLFFINERLIVETEFLGFFELREGSLTKFLIPADREIGASSVYSSLLLSDNNLAIGTVSNGVFVLDKDWNIKYHLTQTKGLSNNTALSLFEDIDKNLWIGLDNGINCINLQSPIKSFSDDTGILGTVYSSLVFQENLYIGTNQGLFVKKLNNDSDFKFIEGTKGQVWSLFENDNTLFCGHNTGTFVIENEIAKQIYNGSGTWKIENIPNRTDVLIQGNYIGLSILYKQNGEWKFSHKINGFDYSSKHFEITNNSEVYISHEYKGVFRLELDSNLKQTKSFFTYKNPTKGKNSCLIKFNEFIYYAYKEGVYKLNTKTKEFEKDVILSNVFKKDEYTSGKLIVDKSNRLWLFTKNYIHYFSLSKLSNQLKENVIPIPASLTNSMLGYENITQLYNSIYLIGTTDGYYTINLNDLTFKDYKLTITNVAINKLNEKVVSCSVFDSGSFKYNENNIIFSYSVPEYNKYINAEYQFLLEGFQNEWSEWSSKTSSNFKNLPPGEYTFKVRSKIANSKPDDIVVYKFTILKPWYFTNLALFVYSLLLIILGYYVNKAYKNYYREKEQKLIEENNLLLEIKELENAQQLMKIKNEQLTQDVDSKKRELAVSTMSLIKKDELLTLIKEDLKNATEITNKNVKTVISTITKNINKEDSWNTFKEAFDNADNDFLKKVKHDHPSLTPNDLRLCAYLRLNLSSKEIAPLLNISVRSVEIKRYRLRKKMNLDHEQGLVEYILSF